MDLNKLEKILEKYKEPRFRLDQIKKAVYKDGVFSFAQISNIPLELRESLQKELKILSFSVENLSVAKDKKSIKALLILNDNNKIESVLLESNAGSYTVCLSSQAGCPLACLFCATGQEGYRRNLTAEEITDQVLFWRAYLRREKNIIGASMNIVFMGMGEPFLNWDEVKTSIADFINPQLFGIASRNISVSTIGVKGKIEKFARAFPQVNLAISLHFTDDKKRDLHMPANRSFNLDDIKKALQKYFQICNRKVFIEYIMLDGLNDTVRDAEKLAEYIKTIGQTGLFCVNLISYNQTAGDLKPSPKERLVKFKNILLRNNINATIRKSLGNEIEGACGQLASSKNK
jgi:23S rRNA (adenine(2503)-C(2))-methyltransferase